MAEIKQYSVLGIMSGTSLDGVDLALCSFSCENGMWCYKIIEAKTYAYSEGWLERIKAAEYLSGRDLMKLHAAYGTFLGELSKDFLKHKSIDAIASHGHTVFHESQNSMTFQMGLGANIAVAAGANVICDFRTIDVALGGNGAPLVPFGDEQLFLGYAACINLGGFANVSFRDKEERLAYDICPVNMLLNKLANKIQLSYDDGGQLAKVGEVNVDVLRQLNNLPFYKKQGAKSLGKEWFDEHVWPLLKELDVSAAMATGVEHIAEQITQSMKLIIGNILCTGGGAYNDYLITRIRSKLTSNQTLIVPENQIIDFKEAMLFAFLGACYLNQEPNVLSTSTGSSKNHIGGCLYYGQ
jgi:anhydro-N-acetylmuramic acid kinase